MSALGSERPPREAADDLDVPSKDEVAQLLARAHYEIDSGVTRIYRMVSSPEREADPAEPIKLLEVYEHAIPSGVFPAHFPPHPPSGLMFPAEIIQLAPDEFARLGDVDLSLPDGWRIDFEYPRPVGRGRPLP